MFAGGKFYETDESSNNSTYYMYTGQHYWTMSPSNWTGIVRVFFVNSNGYLDNSPGNTDVGLRPVINLNSDITFSSGDGTKEKPYTVAN